MSDANSAYLPGDPIPYRHRRDPQLLSRQARPGRRAGAAGAAGARRIGQSLGRQLRSTAGDRLLSEIGARKGDPQPGRDLPRRRPHADLHPSLPAGDGRLRSGPQAADPRTGGRPPGGSRSARSTPRSATEARRPARAPTATTTSRAPRGTSRRSTSPATASSQTLTSTARARNAAYQSAVAGCDLYLYEASLPLGHRLIQVSAGENVPGKHTAGKGARTYNGIVAISADGSHVYFAATGALTSRPNPEGDEAEAGEPNLYTV